jgi:hypothetical protein
VVTSRGHPPIIAEHVTAWRLMSDRGTSAVRDLYSAEVQQRGGPRTTPTDCQLRVTCPNDRQQPRRREFASRGTVTPTTDTNESGRSQASVDLQSVVFQATDRIGHLGWALQASDHVTDQCADAPGYPT